MAAAGRRRNLSETRRVQHRVYNRFPYGPAVTTTQPMGEDLLGAEPAQLTGGRIGYARVSTSGQLLDRQIRALEDAGCVRVFADKLSGRTAVRPELVACLDYLRPGDTL